MNSWTFWGEFHVAGVDSSAEVLVDLCRGEMTPLSILLFVCCPVIDVPQATLEAPFGTQGKRQTF